MTHLASLIQSATRAVGSNVTVPRRTSAARGVGTTIVICIACLDALRG